MTRNLERVLRIVFTFLIISFSQISFAGPCDTLKSGQAAFFQHAKYQGACAVRNTGRYSSSKTLGIGNDKISSIKLGPRTQVSLCNDSNFKGGCKSYTTSVASLGKMNDKTSSAIVRKTPPPARTPPAESQSANCNPKANQVAFFQHAKYQGTCSVRNMGRYANAKSIGMGNDKISSVKIGHGAQVSVCNDNSFKGRCETYTTSMATLGQMNDKTSSAIVAKKPPPSRTPPAGSSSANCNPNANQVAFFKHANYQGACVVRNVGGYRHSDNIGIGNDKISSVKLGSSAQVKLCEHGNFMGSCKTYKTSMASLGSMNDKTSSAWVERRSATNTPPAKKVDFELKGDTECQWGSKDCNRCVNDVRANFDEIETHFRGERASKMRVRSYAYPTKDYILHRINTEWGYEHIQGVGRIAGLGNDEYLVFTHSTRSGNAGKSGALAVVRMGANQRSNGFALGDLSESAGTDQNIHNRTVARTYSDSNHPGGLATLGHHVFVADWCQPHGEYGWCNDDSQFAFEVYDVSNVHKNVGGINSNPPRRIMDRSVREAGDPLRDMSTASVAATRLKSGKYLVAMGRSGGDNYEYFLSSTTYLSSRTQWSSIGDPEHFSKSGENAAMVNECGSGDIYLIQIDNGGKIDGKSDVDELHLFQLKQYANSGPIKHLYVDTAKFRCSDGSRWCHFAKGGGIYTSPTGNLYLYSTTAQQAPGATGGIYGSLGKEDAENFRMVEFGNKLETGQATAVSRSATPKKAPPYVYEKTEVRQTKTGLSKSDVTFDLRAPSELNVDSVTSTTTTLSWLDNSDREYGVEVYRVNPVEARQKQGITWEFIGLYQERMDSNVKGTGRRSDEDDGLNPGTDYCYRLRAYFGFDRAEVSDYSKSVCTKTTLPKVTVKRR